MDDGQRARQRAIVALRERGESYAQIAARYGITRQRAFQIYRDATWPTNVAEAQRAARPA